MFPAAEGAQGPAITLAADSDFGRLKSRWLRPDGGSVLEIRDVDAGGTIEAAYLMKGRLARELRAWWQKDQSMSDGRT